MSAIILQFPQPEPKIGPMAAVLWTFTVFGMALWVGFIAAIGTIVGAML